MCKLPPDINERVLCNFANFDDAGVYKLSEELALVQTVDFFTPVVDDPWVFGAVAAANSLSDIYAMGGVPLTALCIAGFPPKGDLAILERIMAGGMAKLREAGVHLLGGHTIKDKEMKFGYAITGTIHPQRIITNSAARVGELLILTKPLGIGIITTGIKFQKVSLETTKRVSEVMMELNRRASEIMLRYRVSAATDITGYGLLGHCCEMASASKVSLEFYFPEIPVLPEALELVGEVVSSPGLLGNRSFCGGRVELAPTLNEEEGALLFDPQTSGGLLVASPPNEAGRMAAEMRRAGIAAKIIGRVIERKGKEVYVREKGLTLPEKA